MSMVNGIRTVNNLLSGSLNAAGLQTFLGTPANVASFAQVLNSRTQATLLFNNSNAIAAISGSALALAMVSSSPAAVNVISPLGSLARPSFFGVLQAAGKLLPVSRTGPSTLNPQGFVATIPAGYLTAVATAGVAVYISPDGITWTTASFTGSPNLDSNQRMSSANGRAFFSGYDSVGGLAYVGSTTGLNGFALTTLSGSASVVSNVSYSASAALYCCVLQGTTSAYTSSNGTSWTLRTLPSSSPWFVTSTNTTGNLMVASCTSSTVGATSTDGGLTWTARASGYPNVSQPNLIFDAKSNLFVMFTSTGSFTAYYTTPDGITWTTRTTPITFNSMVVTPTQTIGYTAFGIQYVTTDQVTFTPRASTVTPNIYFGIYHATRGEALLIQQGAAAGYII